MPKANASRKVEVKICSQGWRGGSYHPFGQHQDLSIQTKLMILQVSHRHTQGASCVHTHWILALIPSHTRQCVTDTPFEEPLSKVTDFKATREIPQSSIQPASKLLWNPLCFWKLSYFLQNSHRMLSVPAPASKMESQNHKCKPVFWALENERVSSTCKFFLQEGGIIKAAL